jgi:cytochrome c peroxidase
MGSEMGGDGSYDPGDSGDDPLLPNPENGSVAARGLAQKPTSRTIKGATRQEWRTPPLWGFRDSGPYLHDGRAQTLEQAVALHGGQGEASAQKFFELTPKDRLQVESFLKSLVAPPSVQVARRGE